MRESAEFRSSAVRAVLLRFYPHQYAWCKSCAVTVSFLLTAATPDRDGQVRNRISHLTVAVRSRMSPRARALLMHIA